jgi:hypothetical protein
MNNRASTDAHSRTLMLSPNSWVPISKMNKHDNKHGSNVTPTSQRERFNEETTELFTSRTVNQLKCGLLVGLWMVKYQQ